VYSIYVFAQYHTKILLGHFNAKVDKEDIFKPKTRNKSLHEISYVNGISVVNFATSKNLTLKSTMFPHHNIHKLILASPDEKTHNQSDHILIDGRQYSSVLDVQSLRAADTDHYLMVAKFRDRLTVSKQIMHKFHMEKFNLQKLDKVEGKEQYFVEVSNRFAVLEDLDTDKIQAK
jgi:hypothetical protein